LGNKLNAANAESSVSTVATGPVKENHRGIDDGDALHNQSLRPTQVVEKNRIRIRDKKNSPLLVGDTLVDKVTRDRHFALSLTRFVRYLGHWDRSPTSTLSIMTLSLTGLQLRKNAPASHEELLLIRAHTTNSPLDANMDVYVFERSPLGPLRSSTNAGKTLRPSPTCAVASPSTHGSQLRHYQG
jgi:hypothetical protein